MARLAIGGPRPTESPWLGLLRAAAALLGTTFVLVALLYSGYLGYTDIEPEDVSVTTSELAVDPAGREVAYGRSRIAREGRVWRLHLEGSPEEIGDAHGRLTARLFSQLDAQVQAALDERYAGWLEPWTGAMLLRWDYRGADRQIPEAFRRELSALAAAMPEAATERASSYHRLFLYQCFQDLVTRLDDVVLEGSMFAATRRRGAEPGNMIIGHTLSFDLGPGFEGDRVVTFYRADGRYPFVSVGWAGLIGTVTGINARGIFVGLNTARTDDPLYEGAPLPIVLRKVLGEADTLEHAVEMIKDADLRTSGIVLVADGVQREAVVLELAPRDKEGRRVVRGKGESVVWATNHMVSESFEGDLQNDWVRRYTSSDYRMERLGELFAEAAPVDPQRAVEILRDRRGHDDVELGLGNPNALDNLLTTHSVVIDATAMVMWVGEGPSNLGRYQAFDLARMLGRAEGAVTPLEDLPADPLLHSEDYEDYLEALEALAHARKLLLRGYADRALVSARIALALAPDVGELHRLLGDIERDLGHPEEAIGHYRRYLELVPGRRREQVRVEGIIEELAS